MSLTLVRVKLVIPMTNVCRYCVPEPEKEALNCYTGASCDNNTDIVTVQPTPMLVSIGSVETRDSSS